MKHLTKKILIICILSMPLPACAEEISKAFMREYETGSVIYIDKETSSQRSKSSFSTKRTLQGTSVIYMYTSHGEGDYDEYKNITFDIEVRMEEKNGLIYPIYSLNSIKNKDGGLITRHEKRFDYAKEKIYYVISDAKGNVIKNIAFPMKGLTVDGPTMIHFLKTFAAHSGEKPYKIFYLISEKAQLYKINIKDMGIEILETSQGEIKAVKFRLIPDLGLLTGIAKSLIPPTFIWYTAKEPYEWLQYEGLETGIGSTHVIIRKLAN